MDLILNGEPRTIDASGCLNLAELIAETERQAARGEPSVVVSVEIDGEPLGPDLLDAPETVGFGPQSRVELVLRPSREVALGVLAQGADYCVRIVAAIADAAELARAGRTEPASRLLADILDSLSVLTGITCSIAAVLPEEARALAELQSEIQPWLEQMLEAQSVEDPIRLADLLEYEIAPRIESWGEAMRNASRAQAPVGAGR